MKTKLGYYPLLDLMLALRQIYSGERFKPYVNNLEDIIIKLSDDEKKMINDLGELSSGWLQALENCIQIVLFDSSSVEEILLKIRDTPNIISENIKVNSEVTITGDFLISLWQNYFNSEIAKNNKTIFQKILEISESLAQTEPIEYLLRVSDRIFKSDDDYLNFLIKPDLKIHINSIDNIIIMPSIFASRNLTFWHNGNNYLFFVSVNSRNSLQVDPSDQLLLKTLAFNDKTRLKMLRLLSSGNYNTAEMAEKLNNNPSTISRHFKVFKDAGYVDIFSQEGNFINYSINLNEIENSLKAILNYINGMEESK